MRDQVVKSPSGITHRQRGDSLMTLCGVPWVDLFWSYEHGLAWPRMDEAEPVTCKNCNRVSR